MEIEMETSKKELYVSDLEWANHYDNIRDIEKMFEYSFKLIESEEYEIGIIKIIYWATKMQNIANIIKLFEMIKNNSIKIEFFKQTFLKENGISFKVFLIRLLISNAKKEKNKISCMSISKKTNYECMEYIYAMFSEPNICVVYNMYIEGI